MTRRDTENAERGSTSARPGHRHVPHSVLGTRRSALFFTQHWLLLGILLVTTLGALPLLVYPLGKDQGIYATVGLAILKGGVPYVNAWELKPPAIHYLYALALWLFGRSPAAVHALDLVTVPITTAGLYWLGRRLGGLRVALLAALMFPTFYLIEHFASLAQSDSISTLPMTLAAVCAFKAGNSPRASRSALGWSFAAGALCAWTLWFKHYYIFFVAALVVNQVLARRGLVVKEALTFGIGGLLVGGSALAYLLARGAVGDMLATARGASQYTAAGASLRDTADAILHYFASRWQQWGPVIALAALWPVVKFLPNPAPLHVDAEADAEALTPQDEAMRLEKDKRTKGAGIVSPFSGFGSWIAGRFNARQRRRPLWGAPPGWHTIVLWWLGGLAFLLIQAKGFDTHWIPMLPPLCLLAADSAATIMDRLAQVSLHMRSLTLPPSRGARLPLSSLERGLGGEVNTAATDHTRTIAGTRLAYTLAAIGLLAILYGNTWGTAWRYLTGQESQLAFFSRFQANDVKPAETLQVVNFLKERVASGDTLYIWGLRPEVYFLSGLTPATRFIAHVPLVGAWYPPEWKQENVDTLWAAMPPYVLVLQADYMPWVLGTDKDSHTLLVEYKALSDWLAYNYERDTQIGDFLIWRRKS